MSKQTVLCGPVADGRRRRPPRRGLLALPTGKRRCFDWVSLIEVPSWRRPAREIMVPALGIASSQIGRAGRAGSRTLGITRRRLFGGWWDGRRCGASGRGPRRVRGPVAGGAGCGPRGGEAESSGGGAADGELPGRRRAGPDDPRVRLRPLPPHGGGGVLAGRRAG